MSKYEPLWKYIKEIEEEIFDNFDWEIRYY